MCVMLRPASPAESPQTGWERERGREREREGEGERNEHALVKIYNISCTIVR